MRVAVIFADGVKQINLTPENNDEKLALKMITIDDDISLAVHHNIGFARSGLVPLRAMVNRSQGGYLRVYDDAESTMLVLTPKTETAK